MLEALPELPVAELEEVRELIEVRLLWHGIGFVDAHLLASLLIAAVPTEIWTDDTNLANSARSLGVLATPSLRNSSHTGRVQECRSFQQV
jgi:hypothetical protein